MFLSSEKDKKPYICAIYTRISEQEKDEISPFDTIEAQRERSEQYIRPVAQLPVTRQRLSVSWFGYATTSARRKFANAAMLRKRRL